MDENGGFVVKIAVITDLHYAKEKNLACPDRAGEKAAQLLSEAAIRLNKEIKPDILLVGGDLINTPDDAFLLEELAEIFQTVNCPQIIIPGNHDPNPDIFYQYFQKPPEFMDIAGIRFLAFPEDLQTEGYNARRTPEDLERMKIHCSSVPTILFQHVPFYKRDSIKCHYSYDNAEEIFESCRNVILSISGHEHAGFQPSFRSQFPVVIVPALCEGKNPFAIIELTTEGILKSYQLQYISKPEI